MSKEEVEKYCDKIDSAKERNAINDLSLIAYELLSELIIATSNNK